MFTRTFKLRFVVKNFSEITTILSESETYFKVPWKLCVKYLANGNKTGVYLQCERDTKLVNSWFIDTSFTFSFPTVTGVKLPSTTLHYTFDKRSKWGFQQSKEKILEAICDNTLIVECDVTILSMKGIPPMRFMSFDKPNKNLTDCVVEVGQKKQKFYLSKSSLAINSDYFKIEFYGLLSNPQKISSDLSNKDPELFHSIMEIIYGHKALNEDNVVGILELATCLLIERVRVKCEQCLIHSGRFENNIKMLLADKYVLENLKFHLYDSVKTIRDYKNCIPSPFQLSQATLAMFHDKNQQLCG